MPLASTATSPGSTSTTASYSMPLASSAVTTCTRPGSPVTQPATSSRRRTGVITPTGPSTAASCYSALSRTASGSDVASTTRSTGSTPVLRTADGSGRSGMIVRITDAATAKISDEFR